MSFPVVKSASYILAHVPSLVRYGSKPYRELPKDTEVLLPKFLGRLRSFEDAVAYPPHQVFIGNMRPDDLWNIPQPWFEGMSNNHPRTGAYGEIMPEEEFYAFMRICDDFKLLYLEKDFTAQAAARLSSHPMIYPNDLNRLGEGDSIEDIQKRISDGAHAIYIKGDQVVGCLQRAHDEDESLSAQVLMENLTTKTAGVLALRHLLKISGLPATNVDYLIGCGEEAVGDRYNRGGGALSKAMAEMCGCVNSTGSDVKAFCCSPIHSMVLAASLVSSGIFKQVVVIGGSSMPKLGMKFKGHLSHEMPILEDVLAGMAFLVSPDDGVSPQIRLDTIGKHDIGAGTSQQALIEHLVVKPIYGIGRKLLDIDKYALEMHNPEITEPAGSGNVPHNNYRMVGSMAAIRKEIPQDRIDEFEKIHGMPGFSPTQGHIAAGVPFMGHAIDLIKEGQIKNTMFVAKGSLFLGRMTNLSDGMSFLLEKNEGGS